MNINAEKMVYDDFHEPETRTFDLCSYIQQRADLAAVYRRLEWNAAKVNQPKILAIVRRTSYLRGRSKKMN